MALHPNKEIVATGQMAGKELNEKTVVRGKLESGPGRERGKTGRITSQGKLVDVHIWSATTRELITTIFGF